MGVLQSSSVDMRCGQQHSTLGRWLTTGDHSCCGVSHLCRVDPLCCGVGHAREGCAAEAHGQRLSVSQRPPGVHDARSVPGGCVTQGSSSVAGHTGLSLVTPHTHLPSLHARCHLSPRESTHGETECQEAMPCASVGGSAGIETMHHAWTAAAALFGVTHTSIDRLSGI